MADLCTSGYIHPLAYNKEMTKIHKEVLRKNHVCLVETIDPVLVLDYLFQEGVLDDEKKQIILAAPVRQQQVRILLDILPKTGEKGYYTFLATLQLKYKFLTLTGLPPEDHVIIKHFLPGLVPVQVPIKLHVNVTELETKVESAATVSSDGELSSPLSSRLSDVTSDGELSSPLSPRLSDVTSDGELSSPLSPRLSDTSINTVDNAGSASFTSVQAVSKQVEEEIILTISAALKRLQQVLQGGLDSPEKIQECTELRNVLEFFTMHQRNLVHICMGSVVFLVQCKTLFALDDLYYHTHNGGFVSLIQSMCEAMGIKRRYKIQNMNFTVSFDPSLYLLVRQKLYSDISLLDFEAAVAKGRQSDFMKLILALTSENVAMHSKCCTFINDSEDDSTMKASVHVHPIEDLANAVQFRNMWESFKALKVRDRGEKDRWGVGSVSDIRKSSSAEASFKDCLNNPKNPVPPHLKEKRYTKCSPQYAKDRQQEVDTEKFEIEIANELSKCVCSEPFYVAKESSLRYAFGEADRFHIVSRVSSGLFISDGAEFRPVQEFFEMHDPCRLLQDYVDNEDVTDKRCVQQPKRVQVHKRSSTHTGVVSNTMKFQRSRHTRHATDEQKSGCNNEE